MGDKLKLWEFFVNYCFRACTHNYIFMIFRSYHVSSHSPLVIIILTWLILLLCLHFYPFKIFPCKSVSNYLCFGLILCYYYFEYNKRHLNERYLLMTLSPFVLLSHPIGLWVFFFLMLILCTSKIHLSPPNVAIEGHAFIDHLHGPHGQHLVNFVEVYQCLVTFHAFPCWHF